MSSDPYAGIPAPPECKEAYEQVDCKPRQVVNLVRGSEIKIKPITWVWPGWLAAGKIHILGGAPGTGKTTIAMVFAATISSGANWPDGGKATAGNVVIWSGEDDPADTLAPRLAAAGANLSRVYFIKDAGEGTERRVFDPAKDMNALKSKLAHINDIRLLIVDPIVSAISGDSHKNAEVRRGLMPLDDLAHSMDCAVLGITHLTKGTSGRDPVERINGSLAFGALARVVMVTVKQQQEDENGRMSRLLLRAKSNIGADDGGFEYDLHQKELKTHQGVIASTVTWIKAVEGTARELLATAETFSDDNGEGTLSDAKSFLVGLLADGDVSTKQIKSDADGAGYSWATIRRAQNALKVEAIKTSMKGGWVWRLPDTYPRRCSEEYKDAQQKTVSTFGKFEHLREQNDEQDTAEVYL